MGIRGELFSTKVPLQNRTYFFNVKENRLGDLYLNIVESKNRDEGGFDRQSVILFADDLQDFLKGFDESLRVLEKAVREKRRGPSAKREQSGNERNDAPNAFRGDQKSQRPEPRGRDDRGERRFKPREDREKRDDSRARQGYKETETGRARTGGPPRKRVVVKK